MHRSRNKIVSKIVAKLLKYRIVFKNLTFLGHYRNLYSKNQMMSKLTKNANRSRRKDGRPDPNYKKASLLKTLFYSLYIFNW